MNIEITNKLVKLRKKHNLSQEELANKLGLSRQAISKWERAESSPDTDNLITLAKLYNISLDELLLTNDDNRIDAYDYGDIDNSTDTYDYENIDNVKIYNYKGSKTVKIFRKKKGFWALFPFPLLVTILFFALGFIFDEWDSAWVLFITIPLYYSLVRAIEKKKFYHFSYPVFVIIVYLFISINWNLWNYSWLLFVTIPLYYGIIDAYKKSKRHK